MSLSTSDAIQLAIAIPAVAAFIGGCFLGLVKIHKVVTEVTPNGGKSLKDRVIFLESTQKTQMETLKYVQKTQKEQLETLGRIEGSVQVLTELARKKS